MSEFGTDGFKRFRRTCDGLMTLKIYVGGNLNQTFTLSEPLKSTNATVEKYVFSNSTKILKLTDNASDVIFTADNLFAYALTNRMLSLANQVRAKIKKLRAIEIKLRAKKV